MILVLCRYTAVIDVVQQLGQALDITEHHQELLKFGDLSDPDVVDYEVLHRNTSLPPELELLNDSDAVQVQLSLYEELCVAVQDNLSGYITGMFKYLDPARCLQRVKRNGKLQSFSAEYGSIPYFQFQSKKYRKFWRQCSLMLMWQLSRCV